MSGAKKKRSKKRKSGKSANRSFLTITLKRLFVTLFVALFLGSGGFALFYFLSPIERRVQLEELAIEKLQALRTAGWIPESGDELIARIEDRVPGSEGFSVDVGEIGGEPNHFLAGTPLARQTHQVLQNGSYSALFDTNNKQVLCVGLRLTGKGALKRVDPDSLRFKDPRVVTFEPTAMQFGQWRDYPLAPPKAIGREHGEVGKHEINLTSNLVPMPQVFAEDVWQPLIEELSIDYPWRFQEVWLYLGPVYTKERSKMSSGVPIPDAFFAIVFDQTEAGALRALSFLVPTASNGQNAAAYLSSISQIESLTGLQFLPELRPHTRQSLAKWQSPRLW